MAISTIPKPTIYRTLYENTGWAPVSRITVQPYLYKKNIELCTVSSMYTLIILVDEGAKFSLLDTCVLLYM